MSPSMPRCRPVVADDLPGLSLSEVLLHGLVLDDEDPALGVLAAARRELGVLALLAESSLPGADFGIEELVPVIEIIGRRLDVAIELFTRAQREKPPEGAADTPPTGAAELGRGGLPPRDRRSPEDEARIAAFCAVQELLYILDRFRRAVAQGERCRLVVSEHGRQLGRVIIEIAIEGA